MLLRSHTALAPFTTLQLGGPATRLVELEAEAEVMPALAEARARGEPVFVLGGGSNVVIADEGFPGTVLHMAARGVEVRTGAEVVELRIAAGESWDSIVAQAVESGWAGIECLAGIPGTVGATPIQNVGAYGDEVGSCVAAVHVLDRVTGERCDLSREACAFGYRTSLFKREPERFVVLAVHLRLARRRESGGIRYAELARALGLSEGGRAPITRVREAVLALRRAKGMVVDPRDPDSVSAGSFFMNPIIGEEELRALEERAVATLALGAGERLPRHAAGEGRWKVPAGWLIERAGLRGFAAGAVAVSPKHALALVHRGGGSTRELLALAAHVRDTVQARFGLTLMPEPVLVGAAWPLLGWSTSA